MFVTFLIVGLIFSTANASSELEKATAEISSTPDNPLLYVKRGDI